MHIKIDDYEFRYICTIEPERNVDSSVKRYMSQSRYENKNNLPLNRYGKGPFCKFRIPSNYPLSGVYAIVVKDKLKYIGECLNVSLWYNMGLRDHIIDLDIIAGKELTWFYFNDHQFKGIGSIMQHTQAQ